MPAKKHKSIPKRDKKSDENPWAYQATLEPLLETTKLSRDDMSALCCMDKYQIQGVMFNSPKERNDEVYRIFGDMVGQNADFMRRWLRVHVLTHRQWIATFTSDYLKSKGLDIVNWLNGPKTGKQADILALFLLCKITKSHCFIHLKNGGYWLSLEQTPQNHDDLLQQCNLHLAYLGAGNYAQLSLCTTTYEYEIFGLGSSINIDVVETKPLIIG